MEDVYVSAIQRRNAALATVVWEHMQSVDFGESFDIRGIASPAHIEAFEKLQVKIFVWYQYPLAIQKFARDGEGKFIGRRLEHSWYACTVGGLGNTRPRRGRPKPGC